jgi:hypothetical protein
MAVRFEHGMQLNQRIQIILPPAASIADHGRKIGDADHMAFLHCEIRSPCGSKVAHLAFRTSYA